MASPSSSSDDDTTLDAQSLWGKGGYTKHANRLADAIELANKVIKHGVLDIDESEHKELEEIIKSGDMEKDMIEHRDLQTEFRKQLRLLELFNDEPILPPLPANTAKYDELVQQIQDMDQQLFFQKEKIWPSTAPILPAPVSSNASSSNLTMNTLSKTIDRLEDENSDLKLKAKEVQILRDRVTEQEKEIAELKKNLLRANMKLESIAVNSGKMEKEDRAFYLAQLAKSDHSIEVTKPIFDKALEEARRAFAALPVSTPNHPSRFSEAN